MSESPRILALFGSVALFGAERGNIEALAALKGQGAVVTCLVSDEPWNVVVPGALEARGFVWRKVPYMRMGRGLGWHDLLVGNLIRFVSANLMCLRAAHEFRPTHIHAYAPNCVINFAVALLVLRAPLVYRAGDEPTLHNRIWRIMWRFVRWRTAQFVANSRFIVNSLIASGIPSSRIRLIYNRPPARHETASPIPDLECPSHVNVIAYIGQIAEHKGAHMLIDAFRRLTAIYPDTRLVLAGRISEWEGDAWARRLRDSTRSDPAIGPLVHFVGELADVSAVLERCLFLAVPSVFQDPSPNVVMEAKAAGRATIAFARGGLPELIEHGVDGLICRDASAASLAEAIRLYLERPELAREHGDAAAKSLERLGVPDFAVSWGSVYAHAAGHSLRK